MVVLNPENVIAGPTKTPHWGPVVTIDLGRLNSTLAISRDNRLPRPSVIVTMAARELMRLSKAGDKVKHIFVIGSDIDPTEHPGFREVSENLRDLRNKWFPRAKLCLKADSPRLDTAEVRIGASIYDYPIMRLEHGTTKVFSKMTGRKSTELGVLTRQLASLDRVVIRACFTRGLEDNSTESEIRGWIRRLLDVEPTEVQIFSPDARARGKDAPRGITKTRLQEILDELGEKVSVPVTVLEAADAMS